MYGGGGSGSEDGGELVEGDGGRVRGQGDGLVAGGRVFILGQEEDHYKINLDTE